MKIVILSTGEVQTVNACYGLRLLEQGIAKLAPAEQEKPEKPEKKRASRKESGESNGTD